MGVTRERVGRYDAWGSEIETCLLLRSLVLGTSQVYVCVCVCL
jgi:hypothetical protein